jgi:hypothetical protein
VRCSVALVALTGAFVAFAACGRERKPPPQPTPSAAAATPDPRLQAAFADVFTQAGVASAKARQLHESQLLSASRPDDSPASR